MSDLARAAEGLQPFGLPAETSLDDLGPLAQALADLTVEQGIPANWFVAFASPDVREAAAEWQQACTRFRATIDAQAKLLDLPRGIEPGKAADRLSAAWSSMAGSVPAGTAVIDLPARAAELHGQAAVLTELDRTAAEMSAAFGITATRNLDEVAATASAVSLAAELPQTAAGFVTPELMRVGSTDVVASSAWAIRTARSRRADLDARFSIAPSLEPSALRRHAAVLAAAGPFGFMKPAVKAAKLAFLGLCRSKRKATKAEMMDSMVSVAEYLEAVAAIEADTSSRAAFGTSYLGLTTDIEAAVAVVAWAARVRSALPQTDGVAASARAVLLSGDPDRLRNLRALATRREHKALQAYLARSLPATTSFADLATQLDENGMCVETLAAACSELGVPAATRASDLPAVCEALRATAKAKAEAVAPDALGVALGEPCLAPLDEHERFDAALALALSVDRLSLPAPMRATLSLASPEALRTIAVPTAVEVTAQLDSATKRWTALKLRLELDELRLLGRPAGIAAPGTVAEVLSTAASHPGDLGSWITYLRERQAVEEIGLGGLLRLWDKRILSCPLATAFARVFHRDLARAVFAQHPELERFTGLSQQDARARFAALDRETAALRREYLADQLGNWPVPIGTGMGKRSEYTDRSLILHEIGKQKRHIPIRQLLDRAGGAVQALKPCFLMSPLSVAQYLKPDGLRFDLLVIDEASQMRPEDAVGAVARCGQIVVVGDPKQLPPTAFFARSMDTDDDDEWDEQVDAESILDLAQAVFRPMRRLRWHYRSRHGSLVAFSNRKFYDGDLIVFPSPSEAGSNQGVRSVKVEGVYTARSNIPEMKAVCAAAVEHMRTCPDRSLGIATMNGVQRDLIAEEMDRLATAHPEVEAYRERWGGTLERFFVKNLENVQGDERDVIFVSTVFGPAAPGSKPLQRFGPINGASGHRRLNVLFTRAKHHLRLFTSMTPDDIVLGPGSSRGAQVLKDYLAYAETGRLEAGTETGRSADSDFEVFVRERLELAGYEAVPQVGVAGFFIDLAVRDPRSPATFLLGIECDGASYHSSRSARDRDILRQQVLEGLGWTIYRIWSTDWFRDPEGQTKKLVSFINHCLETQLAIPEGWNL